MNLLTLSPKPVKYYPTINEWGQHPSHDIILGIQEGPLMGTPIDVGGKHGTTQEVYTEDCMSYSQYLPTKLTDMGSFLGTI